MKATSFVFQTVAAPVTIFGLPPVLAAMLLGVSIPFSIIFTVLGLGFLTLLGPLVIFIIGAAFLWRLRRKERHCETTLVLGKRFFKGKKRRNFVVGQRSKNSPK